MNPCLISSAVNSEILPLNKACEIRIACSRASSPCTSVVIAAASAFCASRFSGASFAEAANSLISSCDKNVKYFKYFITSRSSVLIQNW